MEIASWRSGIVYCFFSLLFRRRTILWWELQKVIEEALELVEQITKEVYNETKGADIRSYILNKEQEK